MQFFYFSQLAHCTQLEIESCSSPLVSSLVIWISRQPGTLGQPLIRGLSLRLYHYCIVVLLLGNNVARSCGGPSRVFKLCLFDLGMSKSN
jgi:hypothetical protein